MLREASEHCKMVYGIGGALITAMAVSDEDEPVAQVKDASSKAS